MLLGIDIGTSGTKTVLFDMEGNALAQKSISYPMYQPRDGWAEQDAEDWWNAAADGIRAVLDETGANPNDVKGVSFSGQMNGVVMVGRDGKPLRRAILWCDLRATRETEEMNQKLGAERVVELTGNQAMPGLACAKILCVRNNQPDIYEKYIK